MAWNDRTLDSLRPRPKGALDMDPIDSVLDASVERNARDSSQSAAQLRALSRTVGGSGRGADEFEPAEFAMNSQTGEIALPNGQVIKANAPILMQLATLTSEDGAPLPKMASVPKGFRPISQAEMKRIIDAIPTESDFWGEAWANGKTTLGLAASAIDSLFGNDDPSNSWSNAARDLESTQTIGELKASRGRWYSSFDSFLSGLGQVTGNVAGVVVGALPVAGAGAAAGAASGGGVGAVPGAVVGLGMGLSGGAAAYGEQATEFYESAVEAMSKMSEEALLAESPLYREVLRENPQIPHEEAIREVAIRGARAAGTAAGLLGAAEAVAGSKLAGNFLARLGVQKSLLGPAMDAVAKRAGVGASAGRVAGRATLGGIASGAEEMGESMLGQAAGAARTGIGSTNPMDYADIEEGIAAAQGGAIFGALGGRARAPGNPLADAGVGDLTPPADQVAAESALGAALRASPNANTPWSRPVEMTPETDLVPAALRDPAFGDGQLQLDGMPPEQAPAAADPAQPQPVDPNQQSLPGMEFGPQLPDQSSIRGRRAAQEAELARRRMASEQNPAPLPQRQSRSLEQQIFEVDDQIEELQAVLAQRMANSPRGVQTTRLKAELKRLQAQLEELEAQWVAQREAEGPMGVPPENRVPAPPPPEATSETTPDGRPLGVAPEPLPNPEPMSPQEAAARAESQTMRGQPTTPEEVAAAAAGQRLEEGVAPTTPEPAADVQAQVQALLDTASERDAVFVADDPATGRPPVGTPPPPQGVTRVHRPGMGTLYTTNQKKAQQFRRAKKDADIGKILGYSETKQDALASGRPVVVQARTPDGAVQAEQVASPKRVAAAKKAVREQAQPAARVVTTTPEDAQARRAAARPAKAAAAVAKSKERSTPKKPTRKAKDDDERTRAEPTPRTEGQAAAPVAAPSDTIERAAKRTPAQVTFRGQKIDLPGDLARTAGRKGTQVDLRAQTLDSEAASRVGVALRSGTLTSADRALAESWLRDYNQLKQMLDAAVTAAEDRLRPVMERAGEAFTREAEQKQVSVEEAMGGKKQAKARTSPLAYLPLTEEETRGFLKALRAEAKAELAGGYKPAQSVARPMINAINGKWEALLGDAREGKRVIEAFANLTDQQLEDVFSSTHLRVRDSTVAKQAMRGATEVAHAMRRMEQVGTPNTQSYSLPDSANHEDARKLSHTTEHGDVPAGMRGVLNEWVQQFERGGNKFSAPIHLMSMRDAMHLRPEAFVGRRVPNGKFLRITDAKGRLERYVLAVNWDRFESKGAALEVLAHEFGHAVTVELYARASPAERKAIDRAYDNWLRRQEGRSVDDILRDQMPSIERETFAGGATNRSYATSFWEWSARNAALYVLDPNRPHLSAIERFFAGVAKVMRRIYEAVVGPKTDRAWAELMDRWVDGSMEVRPMPQVAEASYNHDLLGEALPPANGAKVVADMGKGLTTALRQAQTVFAGGVDRQKIRDAAEHIGKLKPAQLAKKLGLSLMTMRQIERLYRNTPLGAPLSAWVRNQQLKAKTANAKMESGSRALERAFQLDSRVRAILERVMYMATFYEIHPDKAFNDKEHAHLHGGTERTKQVHESRYAHVRGLYEAMTAADPRAAEVYADLRDAFVNLHEDTLAKQLELVEQSEFSDKVKEQITSRIKAAQREVRRGPYFPLMRFGNWIVKVQLPADLLGKGGEVNGTWFDSKMAAREEARNQRALNPGAQVTVEAVEGEPGKYGVRVYQRAVYFFESPAAAEAARPEIEKEVRENYAAAGVDFDAAQALFEEVDDGDGAGKVKGVISQPYGALDDYESTKAGTPEFMAEVRALTKEGKMDPEVAAVLERLAVEALPENNYRKSLLPRQNVLGASKRMLRAYAHRFQGAAHHFATVEHGRALSKSWSQIAKTRETYQPAAEVYNTLLANQQAIRERMSGTVGNRIMNIVTDASSLFSLGFSPAYVLTNSLQPWVVTVPTLAGMTNRNGNAIGLVKATKYLREAYEGALPFFTKRGVSEFIDESKALAGQRGTSAGLQETAKEIITRFGKTEGEQRMLESLLERGTLDFSWLNSIEDAMRGGKASQKWANLQRLAMALPQQVETMNRVVTALAAYRMAKDERLTDGSEAALQEFADDTVADTQLDYSRMNRPLLFNKFGFSVILQFKLYMQGMYMLFGRNLAMAMRGATREERMQGLRTVAYLTATHAAAAGVAGMGPVTWMAKLALVTYAAISGDTEDDWKSGEQLVREMLQDLLGEQAGIVAERGLPALLGIDMSDRLGFPALYEAKYAGAKESDSATTTMDKIVLYSLGAPYSNARRAVGGAAAAWNGDLDGVVSSLPTAARGVARSWRWAANGIVDKNGDQFVPREDLGWNDLMVSALALQPLSVSLKYEQRSEVKNTTARMVAQRRELLQAARTGEDVGDRIREFNASVPKPFRISSDQIKRSKESKRQREQGQASKQEAAVKRMLGG